mgnify:CR=1 FL=1
MIYRKKLGEVIGIYIICSVFSFLFNNGLYFISQSVSILWLVIPPVTFLIFTIWIYVLKPHRFVTLTILTIIFLSVKSELIILYFDLCDITNQHSIYTGLFSSACLATTAYLIIKMFRNKELTWENFAIVFLAMITFEVLFRIEFLSVVHLLNSL